MHIDESLQLWAFLDVYHGSTQSVRLFSHVIPAPFSAASCSALYELRAMTSSTSQRSLQIQPAAIKPAPTSSTNAIRQDLIQINPGGTVIVKLPPATPRHSPRYSKPRCPEATCPTTP